MRHTSLATLVALALIAVPASLGAQTADGDALYKRNCATCHDTGVNRAPRPDAMRLMSAERVLATMETGSMITMANNRTAPERRAIAEFVSGKSLSIPFSTTPAAAAMCRASSTPFDV